MRLVQPRLPKDLHVFPKVSESGKYSTTKDVSLLRLLSMHETVYNSVRFSNGDLLTQAFDAVIGHGFRISQQLVAALTGSIPSISSVEGSLDLLNEVFHGSVRSVRHISFS